VIARLAVALTFAFAHAVNAAPPNIRVAPTIRITLESGTSTTLSVPVPALLRSSDSVSFHVNRTLVGAVSGAGDGTFMSADATVPLLVRAPIAAAPGVHRLADVRFWSADGTGDRVIVPIELTVIASADPSDTATPSAASNPNAATATVRVLPATLIEAAPRSIHLVRVAAPVTLGARDSIAYTVHRAPGAVVGGPSAGVLVGNDSRVTLSVSVPSKALAGALRLAEVRFHVPTRSDALRAETVVAPVEVMVAPVRAISVTPAAPTMHAMPGKRTAVRVVIANGGNVEDTVSLSLTLPVDWRGRVQQSARIVLAPGETVTRDIEVTVPRDHQAGASSVQLYAARLKDDATSSDTTPRTLSLPVEVLSASRGGAFGPVLGLSYNAVQQPGQAYLDSWGFTLTGPISSRVNVSAAWTQRAVGGAPGLSRIGGGQAFPTIAFIHPKWRVDAGNASADFGDMAGLTRDGRGVSATMGDTTWQLSALAARPFTLGIAPSSNETQEFNRSLIVQYGGVLAGLRARALRGGVVYTASASHLRDPLITRAQLDAFALGAERVADAGMDARGELAYRRWNSGSGVGAAAELGNRTTRSDWRLRATHAPGGSRAFARAQTDITMTGGQGLGALRFGYLGWYASDEGERGVVQQTSGIGVMPQFRLGQSSSLGFEARVGSSRSGDASVRLSTLSQIAGLFGSTRVGVLTASASATYTQLQRDFSYFDSRLPREHEDQLFWSTQLLWPTSIGTIDLYSAVQRRAGASVLGDGQHDMALRAEQIAVPFMDKRLYVNAAVGRTVSFGTGSEVLTQRVGLASVLPFQTYIRVDFERNPAFALNGARGWTTALRVERNFGAPAFLRGGRGMGVVFEDLNGNGVRDQSERGLAGVLVRIGGEVLVTDRDGSYRLTRVGAGIPELDERSLPFGLMRAPQVGRATAGALRDGSLDIPVVPVGAVEVMLEIVRDSMVDGTALSLAGVTVAAVDEAGRRHLATLLPDGRAVFDALPPGVYRIDVDGSAAREPLSVQGVSPTVRLDGQRARQTVRVLVGPRRVRVFRAPPVERPAATGRP
jgi:hypothetical protein